MPRTELLRWVELMNRRGHAGIFHSETSDEKRIVERATALEWTASLQTVLGRRAEGVRNAPTDPPDLLVTVDGVPKTVELVELVDGKLLADLAANRKRGGAPPDIFDRTQWSRDRLLRDLNKRLDEKQEKYARNGHSFDFLLIHSDEPWLRASDVREWLDGTTFARRSTLASAHLLLTYDPNERETWPLFVLYEPEPERRDNVAFARDRDDLCIDVRNREQTPRTDAQGSSLMPDAKVR